jgi:hypothetical protein
VTEQDELAGAHWWKARASGDSGGCVEFAKLTTGGAVRDSKYVAGGALLGGPEAMHGLVVSAKNGVLRAP